MMGKGGFFAPIAMQGLVKTLRGGHFDGVYPEPFGCAQGKLRRRAQ